MTEVSVWRGGSPPPNGSFVPSSAASAHGRRRLVRDDRSVGMAGVITARKRILRAVLSALAAGMAGPLTGSALAVNTTARAADSATTPPKTATSAARPPRGRHPDGEPRRLGYDPDDDVHLSRTRSGSEQWRFVVDELHLDHGSDDDHTGHDHDHDGNSPARQHSRRA